MKKESRNRKKSTQVMKQRHGDGWFRDQVYQVAVVLKESLISETML